jgi:hypothetical protein
MLDWGSCHLAAVRMAEGEVARADQVVMALARLWPRVFFVDEEKRRPLAIGIGKLLLDQMAPAIAVGRISAADITLAPEAVYLRHRLPRALLHRRQPAADSERPRRR